MQISSIMRKHGLYPTTFGFLEPTDEQKARMDKVRDAFAECASHVLENLPPSPDRDHVIRTLRDAAMWANVCITRLPDGTPRENG